jgi:hypothetical protein
VAVTETVQLAARVPADLVERLTAIAEADDRTLSYVVRPRSQPSSSGSSSVAATVARRPLSTY